MLTVLAAVNFSNPLVWAVIIGWIMSVVVHEFAHGLVAHLGGDYTVQERGGLSLNPLQYIDPVMSLLIPAVILAIGGVPLPGGVTYIRHDLLRSKHWSSAVSFAGPLSNLLMFLGLAIAVHPDVGWVDYDLAVSEWTPAQRLCATLAWLQVFAALLNLIPVPPLDGFGILSPHMDPETRDRLTKPPAGLIGIAAVFLLFNMPAVRSAFSRAIFQAFHVIGFDRFETSDVARAFNQTLFAGN